MVERCDCLDNVVIISIHVELDPSSRVGMSQASLGAVHVASFDGRVELFEELVGVRSDPAKEGGDDVTGLGGLALHAKVFFDALRKGMVGDTEGDAVLFGWFGQVGLEKGVQECGKVAFGEIVDVFESLFWFCEWGERKNLNSFAWCEEGRLVLLMHSNSSKGF